MTTIRPFGDADIAAFVAVHNRSWPEDPITEKEARYADSIWDDTRYHRHRLAAVDDTGQVIGFGSVRHMQEQFHPDKYRVSVLIDPAARRQGHGGTLYDALREELSRRGAISARAWARESDDVSVQFALDRGFVEVRRAWQSRLDVDGFDMAPFAAAPARVADEGIILTTLAAEAETNPNLWRDMYELDTICARDVPDIEAFTPTTYDDFVKTYITAPYVIPDAFFLAKDGNRYVGVARLWSSDGEPDMLNQDLTGVIPEYRGRGVAMALKLKTVEYARAHGTRQIRTWNDTLNRPMLRINEAMGFQKEPAEIAFVNDLVPSAAEID
jgi:GNAT superfamily N-acetyltransferase